jgi:Leucine-rich repeat (LRR) protein
MSRFTCGVDKFFASPQIRRYDEPAARSAPSLEAFIPLFSAAIIRRRGESFDGVLSRRSFSIMATRSRAGATRRSPNPSQLGARTLRQSITTGLVAAALLGIAGCDKVPTWSELVNGKKKEAPPAPAPVAQQPAPPKAAPQPAPKPAEAPKKTAQEALAQFNNTPFNRRTDAQLVELASLPEARDQITHLELQGSTIGDAGLAVLPKFDHVEKLNISTVNYSSAGMASVAKMKNVTVLWMSRGAQKDKNSDAAMAQLTEMKQLTELYVDLTKFSTAGIAEIAKMTQLEKLSVAHISQFTDEHLQMLAPLVNLKYLDLSGSYVSDDGVKYLLPFTELEFLGMAKMQAVRGRGLKELIINKKGLRKLVSLSVYDNPYLSSEAYEGISHLKSLAVLDAGAANVTNFIFINAMPPLRNLEALSLHDNDALGDDAMIAVPNLKKIKSLYISNNKLISDRSLQYFVKLKSLESLALLQTSVTPTGADRLKAKLKNCKINYNGKML